MRSRVLAMLVVLMAIQAIGCSRLCRCCRRTDPSDRIPPAALDTKIPPPASPSIPTTPTAGSGKMTGAYGGSE